MTRRLALALAAFAVAGCVYFPSVQDAGGVRFKPEKGRLVRQADGAVFGVELKSTGKYGDTLVAASAPIAKRAQLVGAGGAPVDRLEVPGETIVKPSNPPRAILFTLVASLTAGSGR